MLMNQRVVLYNWDTVYVRWAHTRGYSKGPGKTGCDLLRPEYEKARGMGRGVGKAKLEEGLEARGLVRKVKTPTWLLAGGSDPHCDSTLAVSLRDDIEKFT